MGSRNGSGRIDPPVSAPALDPDALATLCELHARVLVLDAEWRRLGEWLEEARRTSGHAPGRAARSRRHRELSEELDALRARIAALRARTDPDGRML